MTCEHFATAFLEGEIDSTDRTHLASCGRCQGELPRLEESRDRLAAPGSWEEADSGLAPRVITAVAAAAAASRRRKRTWWAATAAAVLVVAGVALLGGRSAAPDWEVAIDGTELAPDAGGQIRGWEGAAGTRVALDLSGLEPAPAGSYYELWFTHESEHVSAGTFTSTEGVELWVGVARADYPRLWITLETGAGDTGPSRSTVLDTGP